MFSSSKIVSAAAIISILGLMLATTSTITGCAGSDEYEEEEASTESDLKKGATSKDPKDPGKTPSKDPKKPSAKTPSKDPGKPAPAPAKDPKTGKEVNDDDGDNGDNDVDPKKKK